LFYKFSWDAGVNEAVNWKEFKKYFSYAETKVFVETDGSSDQLLGHDEWHIFKEKHGYGHKE